MESNYTKRELEVGREMLRQYKQELLYNIDGFPEEVTHDGLKQILNIVRLEKTTVDDDFRLKIWLRKPDDQELLKFLAHIKLPAIFEWYIWHLEAEDDATNLK